MNSIRVFFLIQRTPDTENSPVSKLYKSVSPHRTVQNNVSLFRI